MEKCEREQRSLREQTRRMHAPVYVRPHGGRNARSVHWDIPIAQGRPASITAHDTSNDALTEPENTPQEAHKVGHLNTQLDQLPDSKQEVSPDGEPTSPETGITMGALGQPASGLTDGLNGTREQGSDNNQGVPRGNIHTETDKTGSAFSTQFRSRAYSFEKGDDEVLPVTPSSLSPSTDRDTAWFGNGEEQSEHNAGENSNQNHAREQGLKSGNAEWVRSGTPSLTSGSLTRSSSTGSVIWLGSGGTSTSVADVPLSEKRAK